MCVLACASGSPLLTGCYVLLLALFNIICHSMPQWRLLDLNGCCCSCRPIREPTKSLRLLCLGAITCSTKTRQGGGGSVPEQLPAAYSDCGCLINTLTTGNNL